MEATVGSADLNYLTGANICLGFAFVLFNASISSFLKLDVGGTLLIAAFRCVVQLTVMGVILRRVFEANNPWIIGIIAFTFNLLGTFEAVANRSKKRFYNMFPSVLISMLGSTIPVSVIGARYAMAVEPFWTPDRYIPLVGMLCGNAVSGVVVAVSCVLKEIYDNQDKVEAYLSFGASRFEACLPIAREALRLAITPSINQMSVVGIITIPGMMSGAILGGASVEQAARLQMIFTFMLSGSTTLATIVATFITFGIVVDSEHRVRVDRVDIQEHPIWRARNWVLMQLAHGARRLMEPCYKRIKQSMDGSKDMELIRFRR